MGSGLSSGLKLAPTWKPLSPSMRSIHVNVRRGGHQSKSSSTHTRILAIVTIAICVCYVTFAVRALGRRRQERDETDLAVAIDGKREAANLATTWDDTEGENDANSAAALPTKYEEAVLRVEPTERHADIDAEVDDTQPSAAPTTTTTTTTTTAAATTTTATGSHKRNKMARAAAAPADRKASMQGAECLRTWQGKSSFIFRANNTGCPKDQSITRDCELRVVARNQQDMPWSPEYDPELRRSHRRPAFRRGEPALGYTHMATGVQLRNGSYLVAFQASSRHEGHVDQHIRYTLASELPSKSARMGSDASEGGWPAEGSPYTWDTSRRVPLYWGAHELASAQENLSDLDGDGDSDDGIFSESIAAAGGDGDGSIRIRRSGQWGPVFFDPGDDDEGNIDMPLWLFYSQSNPVCARPPIHNMPERLVIGGAIMAVRYYEATDTWTEPQVLLDVDEAGYIPKVTANKVLVTSKGTWLLPFWRERPTALPLIQSSAATDKLNASKAAKAANSDKKVDDLLTPCYSRKSGAAASLLASTDKGATWHIRGWLAHPHYHLIENAVVELSSAGPDAGVRLLMVFRSNSGYLYTTMSHDEGTSWTIPEPTIIPNPDTKADLISVSWTPQGATSPKTALLLAFNQHNLFHYSQRAMSRTRTALRLAVSLDEGTTWHTVASLAERRLAGVRFSYPTMIRMSSKAPFASCDDGLMVVYSVTYQTPAPPPSATIAAAASRGGRAPPPPPPVVEEPMPDSTRVWYGIRANYFDLHELLDDAWSAHEREGRSERDEDDDDTHGTMRSRWWTIVR
ncbi:sialidase [Pycnococcus provasolii]